VAPPSYICSPKCRHDLRRRPSNREELLSGGPALGLPSPVGSLPRGLSLAVAPGIRFPAPTARWRGAFGLPLVFFAPVHGPVASCAILAGFTLHHSRCQVSSIRSGRPEHAGTRAYLVSMKRSERVSPGRLDVTTPAPPDGCGPAEQDPIPACAWNLVELLNEPQSVRCRARRSPGRQRTIHPRVAARRRLKGKRLVRMRKLRKTLAQGC